MTLYVGTSGWQYRDWRGAFYPRDVPQSGWLRFYARRFQCVEVNSTFYRLPDRDTFAAWKDASPEDMVFALKFSRFLTHIRRLREPETAVRRFFDAAGALGGHLGPVLLQLPPTMAPDLEALDRTLRAIPSGVRVAVECRHPQWFAEPTYEVLRDHDAALCLADRGSRPVTPLVRTASWGYVRFHLGRAHPEPCYGDTALQSWAERLDALWGADADVFAFFNNDTHACAPHDASRLARVAARAGLRPTRTPRLDEVTLPAAS